MPPCSLPQPWYDLVIQIGSVAALAWKLKASPRTIHTWAHRTREPSETAKIAIRDLFQRHGLLPPPMDKQDTQD